MSEKTMTQSLRDALELLHDHARLYIMQYAPGQNVYESTVAALTAQAQEIAELREKVERLSLAAIKARQALAHATQFGPVYDTAYNDLDRAIEGATPMPAQQPAK